MQVFLFQEREQVLKLYAENDRLKIQELQDRKKINRLLSLAGVSENEVTYFVKEPPGKIIISQTYNASSFSKQHQQHQQQSTQSSRAAADDSSVGTGKYPLDYESLVLQVNALETQIQEQIKLSKEQTDALLEDRRTRVDEADTQRARDSALIKQLKEKLLHTQSLLHESTKDFLDAKYAMLESAFARAVVCEFVTLAKAFEHTAFWQPSQINEMTRCVYV